MTPSPLTFQHLTPPLCAYGAEMRVATFGVGRLGFRIVQSANFAVLDVLALVW